MCRRSCSLSLQHHDLHVTMATTSATFSGNMESAASQETSAGLHGRLTNTEITPNDDEQKRALGGEAGDLAPPALPSTAGTTTIETGAAAAAPVRLNRVSNDSDKRFISPGIYSTELFWKFGHALEEKYRYPPPVSPSSRPLMQ